MLLSDNFLKIKWNTKFSRYFIQEGVVDIIKTNREVITTLKEGSYFGGIYHFPAFIY